MFAFLWSLLVRLVLLVVVSLFALLGCGFVRDGEYLSESTVMPYLRSSFGNDSQRLGSPYYKLCRLLRPVGPRRWISPVKAGVSVVFLVIAWSYKLVYR